MSLRLSVGSLDDQATGRVRQLADEAFFNTATMVVTDKFAVKRLPEAIDRRVPTPRPTRLENGRLPGQGQDVDADGELGAEPETAAPLPSGRLPPEHPDLLLEHPFHPVLGDEDPGHRHTDLAG